MPIRWLRNTRSPRGEARAPEVPEQTTAVFLDLDNRQGIAQAAVAAAELDPDSPVERAWDEVAAQCYAAVSAYLALTGPDATSSSVAQVHQLLVAAARRVDDFYFDNEAVLRRAAAAAAVARNDVDAALADSGLLQQRLTGPDGRWLSYPAVAAATAALQTRDRVLRDARDVGTAQDRRTATVELQRAGAELRELLERAPGLVEEARRAVGSAGTRLAAVRNRATGVPGRMSTLLREFPADSSADLAGNERRSHGHLGAAEELLAGAKAEAAQDRPEQALALVGQAREEIGSAEELVDSVADRLQLLQGIRADPAKPERDARFRVRDAQRLAIDRGMVGEWGSVLDAQSGRIDRIVAALPERNPDYLKYQRELADVSEFVADIVNRMRQRSAR